MKIVKIYAGSRIRCEIANLYSRACTQTVFVSEPRELNIARAIETFAYLQISKYKIFQNEDN